MYHRNSYCYICCPYWAFPYNTYPTSSSRNFYRNENESQYLWNPFPFSIARVLSILYAQNPHDSSSSKILCYSLRFFVDTRHSALKRHDSLPHDVATICFTIILCPDSCWLASSFTKPYSERCSWRQLTHIWDRRTKQYGPQETSAQLPSRSYSRKECDNGEYGRVWDCWWWSKEGGLGHGVASELPGPKLESNPFFHLQSVLRSHLQG